MHYIINLLKSYNSFVQETDQNVCCSAIGVLMWKLAMSDLWTIIILSQIILMKMLINFTN